MVLRRWLALASIVALAQGGPVQLPNLELPPDAVSNKEAVVELFRKSYTAYKEHAWGSDNLSPLSHSSHYDLNGWGATISDALSTMWVMGLDKWFEEGVDYITKEDFSYTNQDYTVSVFEMTIRYLAGVLSAYELSGKQNNSLLEKAEQMVTVMEYAFTSYNAVPYPRINFTDHSLPDEDTTIAEAGTLTMEWSRASVYTGNETYRQLAEKSVQHIMGLSAVLPGMPAKTVEVSNGESVGSYVTWGAEADSYYEYLIKYAQLTNGTNGTSLYVDKWSVAVDSSIKVLLKNSTQTESHQTYLADWDGQEILHVGSHQACFAGGNWILGGKLTNNDTIFNLGLKLTDSCWNTYSSTATGIGPELFEYISSDGNYTNDFPPSKGQLEFYGKHGYYIKDPKYLMRPEVLESNFYAWRATGDIKYYKHAVNALHSFQTYLETPDAYACLGNVNDEGSYQIDSLPSYWFAETLKYLYLMFDDPKHISLDKYVFNTEGHPFEVHVGSNA